MMRIALPPHVPVIVGLLAMVAGAVDPLEGSLLIVPGAGLVALGALLGRSRFRRSIYWSFGLVSVGVAALWGLSAVGGIGGTSGRSLWWALILLPYPIGWVMGLVGAVRKLREGVYHGT
ncbi:MAG TPA: hypothetical protein VF483_14200 [Gemmatimonadaceae bacterium]